MFACDMPSVHSSESGGEVEDIRCTLEVSNLCRSSVMKFCQPRAPLLRTLVSTRTLKFPNCVEPILIEVDDSSMIFHSIPPMICTGLPKVRLCR